MHVSALSWKLGFAGALAAAACARASSQLTPVTPRPPLATSIAPQVTFWGPNPKTAPTLPSPPALPSTPPTSAEATDAGTETAIALPLSFELPYPVDAPSATSDKAQTPEQTAELARWNRQSEPSSEQRASRFHPGTRVVVDATLLAKRALPKSSKRRVLTQDDLLAQARSSGYWKFRRCYEEHVRNVPDPGGDTTIRLSINRRGKASSARLLRTDLKNESIARCLVSEANKLSFSPAPPRRIDLRLQVGVYAGDVPLPDPGAPAIITKPPLAAFDANAMLQATEPAKAALSDCFASGKARDPALWGRLALRIVLEVDGTVHVIEEHDSRFPDPAVVRCVQGALAQVVFPSVAGRPFIFIYAMRFGEPEVAPGSPIADADAGTQPAP